MLPLYRKLDSLIGGSLNDLVEIRRYIHQHPEPGFKEIGTAAIVHRELEAAGIEVSRIGSTGVVGLLRGKGRRTVALRADMDALQMPEKTRLPYASVNRGCMHACGHDGHTACLIGAARVLAAMRDRLAGNVKFIFQPAEEGDGGAAAMIAGGCMENPRVDAILALHGFPDLPLGTIAAGPGVVMAYADSMRIVVKGKGSHGAYPHMGRDPVVTACRIVEALQTIVSREIHPAGAAVVTIAQFHAGTAFNIIPDLAEISGTIRALDDGVRRQIMEAVPRIVRHTAMASRCTARVSFAGGYPATVNDEKMAALVTQVAQRVLGPDGARRQETTLGAEDFSLYLRKAPGCFFRLGLAEKRRPPAALHNPHFDFNDKALPIGVKVLSAVAMEYLAK